MGAFARLKTRIILGRSSKVQNFKTSKTRKKVRSVDTSQSVNSINQNDKTDHAQLISAYPKHSETIKLNFLNQNAANYKMYDSKLKEENNIWYSKVPLWLLARQPSKPSTNFYLDDSEARIKDSYPNYYYPYTKGVDINTEVKPTWLGEATIEFLRSMFY